MQMNRHNQEWEPEETLRRAEPAPGDPAQRLISVFDRRESPHEAGSTRRGNLLLNIFIAIAVVILCSYFFGTVGSMIGNDIYNEGYEAGQKSAQQTTQVAPPHQ